jgi:glucose-6-phosphate-specific signal transduction histidine kinase
LPIPKDTNQRDSSQQFTSFEMNQEVRNNGCKESNSSPGKAQIKIVAIEDDQRQHARSDF